ncbi:MAG: UUP1 family membrane protein [Candidatus Brocadiaceae bacterium]|nr:UUP1 family membrane protein [Candidatus Brocadiaceae bacterium]
MNKIHFYIFLFGLSIISCGLFSYKYFVLGFPLIPEEKVNAWNIEVHISFDAQNEPVKVEMFLPKSSRNFIISSEYFVSKAYGLTTSVDNINRNAMWSINEASKRQVLLYRVRVNKVKIRNPPDSSPPPFELKPSDLLEPYRTAAQTLVSDVRAKSADIDTFVMELFKRLNAQPPEENVAILLDKESSVDKKVTLAVQLLALADIPARIVHGIRVKTRTNDAQLEKCLEVYSNGKWIAYHPASGTTSIPNNYLEWWRGPDPFVQLKGGKDLKTTISIGVQEEEAINAAMKRAEARNPRLLDFSLFSLPLHFQSVYHLLLLIPVGALLVVILRNVIGLETFGTFMPVLIALSFRETHLLLGIILFSLLVAIGMGARLYLENFRLLMVSRLASLLIIIIVFIGVFNILFYKLGLEMGLSISIFPIVILTMTIERMTITLEEKGAKAAMNQCMGSLITATIVYFFMFNKFSRHVVFIYPELLLLILVITMLLGRYKGYRLTELFRFKELNKIP